MILWGGARCPVFPDSFAKLVCPPPLPGRDPTQGDLGGELSLDQLLALQEDIDLAPGEKAYSFFKPHYTETSWNFFVDAREAATFGEWTCGALPSLVGTNNDEGANRCYIEPSTGGGCTIPPDLTSLDIADRYVFNSATPVLVERPNPADSRIFYYIQQNV